MIRRPTGGWKHVVPARLPTIRPVLYAAASRAYASAAQHAGLTACMTTRNLLVTCPGPSADLMHVEGPLATAIAHVRGVHAALQAPRAWGACRPAGATRQRPCRVHTGVRTWRSSQSERERARRRGVRNCKGQTGVKTMAQATATFGDKVTSMKLGPLLKKNAPWVHRLPCTIAEWNDTLEGL